MARSTSLLVTEIRELCPPDGGCQQGVTLPVNTNARIDYQYETLRTKLASESTYPNFLQVLEKLSQSVGFMEPKFLTEV